MISAPQTKHRLTNHQPPREVYYVTGPDGRSIWFASHESLGEVWLLAVALRCGQRVKGSRVKVLNVNCSEEITDV